MQELIKFQAQQVRAARAAATNINHNICDLQLFVLQPCNQVAAKNKALETTMRIARRAKAIMAIDDEAIMSNYEMLTAMLAELTAGRIKMSDEQCRRLLPRLAKACEVLNQTGESQEAA